jgi:hypothetical protein
MANADTGKAGVYTGTANNIANLGTNTTNGITGQNTQAANAEMQGSSNLWGLGMNLAKAWCWRGYGRDVVAWWWRRRYRVGRRWRPRSVSELIDG